MATKTVVELVDDMDGSEADESLTFGIDNVTYEIDLNSENAEKLREALDAFVGCARKLSTKSGAPKGSLVAIRRTQLPDARPGFTVRERGSMQRFARANDMKAPADRGRISADVSQAWIAAGRPI